MRITSGLLVVALAFLVAADEAPSPKSPAAVGAIQRSDAAIKKAEEALRAAKLAALRQLVTDLRYVMTTATKSGNLQEANAIKAMLDRTQSDVDLLASAGKSQQFVVSAGGQWTKTVQVRAGQTISISTSGHWCADTERRAQYTFGAEGEQDGTWFGLFAKIDDGEPMKVGSAKEMVADQSGELSMKVGGGSYERGDDGELAVTLTPR
jgi:hypothetical protein